jgi:hypothetical protein
MAKRAHLPIDDRLETAAQLVLRARIFYDIWRFFDGADTRPRIIDTMRAFSEFFRFEPHAHFVSFIVHLGAVLEGRSDTINLPRLAKELRGSRLISPEASASVDVLLGSAVPGATKVQILRSNLFAHRSASLSYSAVFKKAGVTPNELCDLTDTALKIVNRLLVARGLKDHVFNNLPLADAREMLDALSRDTAS